MGGAGHCLQCSESLGEKARGKYELIGTAVSALEQKLFIDVHMIQMMQDSGLDGA